MAELDGGLRCDRHDLAQGLPSHSSCNQCFHVMSSSHVPSLPPPQARHKIPQPQTPRTFSPTPHPIPAELIARRLQELLQQPLVQQNLEGLAGDPAELRLQQRQVQQQQRALAGRQAANAAKPGSWRAGGWSCMQTWRLSCAGGGSMMSLGSEL